MKKPMYIGKGDVFSYGRQISFAGEHVTGNDFSIKFTNTAAADKVIAFAPAVMLGVPVPDLVSKVSGVDGWILEDGTVSDADGSGSLSGLPDPAAGSTGAVTAESLDPTNTIDFLLAYAAANPFRVTRLELNSNQKNQFSQRIEQRVLTPWKTSNGEKTINLRKYVNADQFQDDRTEIKLIEEDKELTFSIDTVIYFKLSADSEFEINMDIGAVFNQAETLRRRSTKAHQNIRSLNGGRSAQALR